jgi:hypothetical protein
MQFALHALIFVWVEPGQFSRFFFRSIASCIKIVRPNASLIHLASHGGTGAGVHFYRLVQQQLQVYEHSHEPKLMRLPWHISKVNLNVGNLSDVCFISLIYWAT